jgi:hypothetical protein
MKSLELIKMKGGVELVDKKRRATSQDLVVDVLNKVTLKFTGTPRIYQDQDEISGEEILLLDGGKAHENSIRYKASSKLTLRERRNY